MADEIRCPMCSKNNPAGTETCRFCGARISAVSQTGSDEPDWLRDFRDSSGGSTEGSALPWQNSAAADSSSGLPDWLSSGSDAAQESGADLLGRLSGEEKSPESTPGFLHGVEEPAQPDAPDWLNGFSAGDEAASEPAQQPTADLPPAAGTDDEVINWLKSLGDEAPGDLFTDAPAQPPDTLAWSEDSIADTKQQQTGVTEWLENMAHESPQKPEATPESEQRFQDWLSTDGIIRADEPPVNLPAETRAEAPQELPDWLSAAAEPDAGAAPETPSQPEEELPAWLSGFGAAETGEGARDLSDTSPAAGQPLAAAEFPDWLSADATADVVDQTTQPAASGEDMSDWLSAISAPESVEPEPAAPSFDIPDFSILFAEEKAATEEQLSPEMFGEIPAEPLASAAQPAAEPPSQFEPETPDWLGAFGEAGKEETVVTGGTGSLPFIDEGIPAWLNDVQPPSGPVSLPSAGSSALLDDTQQPQYEAASDEPFQVDLPDWLTDFQPGEAESEVAAGEAEEESDLVHAELPGWVEDLRPIEAIVTGESVVAAAAAGADSGREEKLGPLAGMRGVLPGEESAVRFRKLPTYSARLRVSERQRSHAALLQNILDIEPIAKEIPAVPSQAPQYIYRLVIAAVLIVALLAGMIFTDLEIFPAPQPTANDTGLQTLFNQIESLPSGAPVLLAVDYEPGLSGEMQMASSSVIEHLMLRDVRLIFVSTVPSGPLLAEDLLNLVHPRKNEFNLSTRVANLGYLPGGTTSLLEFARRPSSAAPLAFDGSAVWNGPALQEIQNIQSFVLVLVLTDSAETGRAWVEQVQPLLGATPLSMVASAQAGPMLLPYHEAGQIAGLVNGFLGGAMYEQRSGRVNLANVYWNSYQTGYLAGILMLILGGIISAVLNAARKPRRPKA